MTNKELIDINERLTRVETEMAHVLTNQEDMKTSVKGLSYKMDELLALRNKGAGVFWFVTVLAGTGLFGAVTFFVDLFKR